MAVQPLEVIYQEKLKAVRIEAKGFSLLLLSTLAAPRKRGADDRGLTRTSKDEALAFLLGLREQL